jgi:hypothetical protein
MRALSSLLVVSLGFVVSSSSLEDSPSQAKVQVYILAGQSNMEGHGQLRSLDRLGEHPEHGELLSKLKDSAGGWTQRDDVSIVWQNKHPKSGPLGVGWGYGDQEVGPELMFGTLMGERHEAPVLLIKTAWGGKDVFCDFRSPSAGEPEGDAAALLAREAERGQAREVGHFYRLMLSEVRAALADLDTLVPGYAGQGYELAGLAWFQGWNDFCRWHEGEGVIEDYPQTLAAMFQDLRRELGALDLPIAIGEMGVGGREIERRAENKNDREACAMLAFRQAQAAAARQPGVEGVVFVPTAEFWDDRLEELRRESEAWEREKRERGIADREDNVLPTPELSAEFRRLGGHWYCHYNGSAANYSLVGYALAEALTR